MAATCEKCGDPTRHPTNRYCRFCEKAVRTGMHRDHYLCPTPKPTFRTGGEGRYGISPEMFENAVRAIEDAIGI